MKSVIYSMRQWESSTVANEQQLSELERLRKAREQQLADMEKLCDKLAAELRYQNQLLNFACKQQSVAFYRWEASQKAVCAIKEKLEHV
jgi:hypothetical protein